MPEIERKFLVATIPEGLLQTDSAVRQGYLSIRPVEVRIRSRDGDRHELTVKSVGGLTRTEINVALTAEQFNDLWQLVDGVIEKTRHEVEIAGHVVEVDVYGGKLDGLVIAEVEFDSEQEAASFVPLPWFDQEVTDDPHYRNAALASADKPPNHPFGMSPSGRS